MPGSRHRPRLFAGLVGAASMLVTGTAMATPPEPAVIPPGRERVVEELVRASLAEAPSVDPPSIHIERDRVRIRLGGESELRLIVLPLGAEVDEIGDEIAKGVIVQCGQETSRHCPPEDLARWTPAAEDLARARDRRAAQIWVSPHSTEPADRELGIIDAPRPAPPRDPTPHRLLAGLAALLGIVAAGGNLGRARRSWWWPVAWMVVLLVACLAFSPLLPLHEHNSFLARADCAADPICQDDPAGHAWSIVSLDVLGVFFALLPARVSSYGLVSLLWSALTVLFVYAFVYRLLVRLELGRWAVGGAAFASAFLACHPLYWRLATGGTFWPYAGACTFAAGYFALAAVEADRPWATVVNSLTAGLALVLACASSMVLLTLTPLVALGPACWFRWRGRSALARSAALSAPAVFAVGGAMLSPLRVGFERTFATGDGPGYSIEVIWDNLAWVLAEPSLSPTILVVPALLSLGLLATRVGLRQCVPLAYAGLVPFGFLCVHAGNLFGEAYPVPLINHWWSLPFSAAAAGLGVAWGLDRLERRGLLHRRRVWMAGGAFVTITLASWPFATETWRLLRERRALEHELLAIESALPKLPEHELLLLPRLPLDHLAGAGRKGDPVEVHYPRRIHRSVMRELGHIAPRIVHFDELSGMADGHHVLVYVGSGLRSFQPHEIEGGFVPDSLERPELTALRERYELQPLVEFEVPTQQHELVWTRLGADRVPTVTLGYYRARPRAGQADERGR